MPFSMLQIEACHAYSHDPDLNIKRLVLSGEVLNAVNHRRVFLDTARQYVESGACDAAVPHAREILRLWQETLDMLAARDWDGLSRRLDWVLKRRFLEEVMADNPAMTWKSPEIKHLDLFYGSLNPDEGIYWSLERAGHVDRIVSERDVLRFMIEPPSDTRARSLAETWSEPSERTGSPMWIGTESADSAEPIAGLLRASADRPPR